MALVVQVPVEGLIETEGVRFYGVNQSIKSSARCQGYSLTLGVLHSTGFDRAGYTVVRLLQERNGQRQIIGRSVDV